MGVSVLKLNVRKKGTLIIKVLLRNLEEVVLPLLWLTVFAPRGRLDHLEPLPGPEACSMHYCRGLNKYLY